MKFRENPASGDPSSIQQSFEKIDLSVHCCRYWWLKQWRHQRLSFPYWRLYWNRSPGAFVFYEQMHNLDPEHIILIPPSTPFYTDILHKKNENREPYVIEGGRINRVELETLSLEKGFIPHFFIHFNLGYRFDSIKPGIYPSSITGEQKELIGLLIDNLMKGNRSFSLTHSIAMYNLIISALKIIPGESWDDFTVGDKIQRVINHIYLNFRDNLYNDELARLVHMAPNSFARLFKQQTGQPPQDFIRKKRVEHASKLLYHSDQSIKQISEECGFSDRYYFTRVFTKVMKEAPASYRKKLILNKI